MNVKTKLYSKKQVQEAIEFWTKILENESLLVDALVEDFGYDVVFGRKKILPTLKNIETIYDIVNTYMFSNALAKCPIEIDKYHYCKDNDAAMGYNCFMYQDSEDADTYVLLKQLGKDAEGNVYHPPAIYVNDETFDEPISIIGLASIVAHEMIHQYINEIGNGCKMTYDNDKNNIPYDVHDNDEFNKWKEIANSKLGLHVTTEGSKSTYDSAAIDALKKFAESSYKINEHDNQSIRKVTYGTGLVNITYF